MTWENPSDADTLASYRISWGLWENGLTSYRDANSETGGNAYPTAPASSHTITGLAPGEYIVGVRARYDDNRNGAFNESGKVTVAAPTPTPLPSPTPEPSPEPSPEPAQRGETKDDSSKTRTDPPGNEAEEEELEIAEQQADPCASLVIAEVGGWASNGYALWVWKGSPLDDGGCWVDFKLSYSDDYGATFTEAAVVRRYMHTTATEYRYSISTVPEMSIVSQLQLQVCAPDSDACPHTLKSTDASFDQYYYSRHEDRTKGANTKAVLVPANSSEGGNAAVVGTLDLGTTETHTYRIAMTAGKTYVFDETYRKWAMMSGEWRGAEHFYLPDEFRISLFTKNSAGQLVAVSDFQNQPERGWQALLGDPDFQMHTYELTFDLSTWSEYFDTVRQLSMLFEIAHLFPPGSQFTTVCEIAEDEGRAQNVCGEDLDIRIYDGRQLRTPSYTPTQSGVYYLQVTRVHDDGPVWGPDTGGSAVGTTSDHSCCRIIALSEYWYIPLAGYDTDDSGGTHPDVDDIDENDHPTYMPMLNEAGYGRGLRAAIPYYEISVEVSD